MTTGGSPAKTVRLKASAAVVRVAGSGASREERLKAAAGDAGLVGEDLLCSLLVFYQGKDAEIARRALTTLKEIPVGELAGILAKADLHFQILDFVAKARPAEPEVLTPVICNPAVAEKTLLFLVSRADAGMLSLLLQAHPGLLSRPEFSEALRRNPHATEELLASLRGAAGVDAQEPEEPEEQEEFEEIQEENLSKYQLALEMGVSEKIKMALTGDKEWRGMLIQDSNKLVSSAALKNPRITDGEVLALAKNKAATDDQIRIITLNKDWVKMYQVKLALVLHPRTPLPKALRYMTALTEKDLKALSKSKGVAQVIVNQARRALTAKMSKR